ncbi:hypothetical protein D3C72_2385320 [compost metagenome]
MVAEIRFNAEGFHAECFGLLHGLFAGIQRYGYDIGAGFGKRQGDALAQALGGTGYERCLAFQAE